MKALGCVAFGSTKSARKSYTTPAGDSYSFPAGNRPSIGSWVSYGLGSENDELPSFVALSGGGSATRSGFLPAQHQRTPFSNSELDPVNMIPDLQNKWTDHLGQRLRLDAQTDLLWLAQLPRRDSQKEIQASGKDPSTKSRYVFCRCTLESADATRRKCVVGPNVHLLLEKCKLDGVEMLVVQSATNFRSHQRLWIVGAADGLGPTQFVRRFEC